MKCQNCQQNIPEESKFCPYCQVELYLCSNCGTKYPKNYRFCNNCGVPSNNEGGSSTQERAIKRDQNEIICITPEYVEAHIYIDNMIRCRRRLFRKFWLLSLLVPVAISLFGCLFFISNKTHDIGEGAQVIAVLVMSVCLIIEPLLMLFIARSGRRREKFINKYIMEHDIDPQISTLVSAVLSKMRTLGNMNHRRILKRIPKILLNCYKYIHNYY